jgi:predicted PurR-regulated permease PerM
LHPVSVIVSLLIGLEFFGFIGVFLAVPIAAVLKIVLVEYHLAQEQKRAAELGIPLPVPGENGVATPTLSPETGAPL